MTANSLEDLFVEGLQEMYYTEQQLVDALQELEEGSTEEEIKNAFSEHREETQGHVDRLEEVFEAIGHDAEAHEDPIVDAMIHQHEEFVNGDPDEKMLERYNLMSGQKSEHYEIASYGNLIPLAQQLGHDDVADTLEETLREEQEALDEVSTLSEEFDYGDIESPQ
ncbi:ferritin-like domain-containing protein [Halobium palmae]|uniref:Ferritin-like domain-containing protein n=1 Tax=Halobium palmae TaxID=1776492 RepID=A0ABD5S2T3_9EURY